MPAQDDTKTRWRKTSTFFRTPFYILASATVLLAASTLLLALLGRAIMPGYHFFVLWHGLVLFISCLIAFPFIALLLKVARPDMGSTFGKRAFWPMVALYVSGTLISALGQLIMALFSASANLGDGAIYQSGHSVVIVVGALIMWSLVAFIVHNRRQVPTKS